MTDTDTRPPHEWAIEHALVHGTAIREGNFTLQSGVRSTTHINVRRVVMQPDRVRSIYGHWALNWFDRDKRGDTPAPTRLLGYGEEGERLGLGLQRYLSKDHSLRVVTDSRHNTATKLTDAFNHLNGETTLILLGVIENPANATWLARLAEDVHADLLGVACIASLDPAITAETLGVRRLTVGLQLDAIIKDESGV